MRKPSENEIKDWLKQDTTKYLLETLASKLSDLDTIRNATSENSVELLANRITIETIESLFFEFYKELPELQKKVDDKLKIVEELKGCDY